MAATVLQAQLDAFLRLADGNAVRLAVGALSAAATFVRDSGRESWRRPGPAAFQVIAENARQAALLVAKQAAATLKEPPPPPSPENVDEDTRPEPTTEPFDLAALDALDDWYANPCRWRDCYRGTVSLRHTDVTSAVLVRAVEKALAAAGLDDAYVTVEDDLVVVYWAPDEHEDWERDLLLSTLEVAAQAVELESNRVKIRWWRYRDWERAEPA